MTPFASVAMLEKFALLKIALCSAPVCSRASACRASMRTAAASAVLLFVVMRSGSRVVEQARTCDARDQEWEAVQHRRKDLSREAPLTPPKVSLTRFRGRLTRSKFGAEVAHEIQ